MAASPTRLQEVFAAAAAAIRDQLQAAEVQIVEGVKGTWRVLSAGELSRTISTDLLAEALDRQAVVQQSGWIALPWSPTAENRWVVAVRMPPGSARSSAEIGAVVGLVAAAGNTARETLQQRDRAQRLASMLQMTTRWNQTRETSELLEAMAATSTRLLDAERATIFLWDRANRQLIGRPATGIAEGEIRIPEGAGVVGQVVARGEPIRVDADVAGEQAQIDRSVDRQSGFATRSLLCVPLTSPTGDILGAFELINKREGNFGEQDLAALRELAESAAVAIANSQYLEQVLKSRRTIADQAANQIQWIGESRKMRDLKSTIARVAHTELAVLLLGENGTGKDVAAQSIHYLSPRRDQVLVAVNCAALTESLLESELFGHEKGAFTDAHEPRAGKFELANGGTLFLDEIGDMSLSGQAKLLRVLEEKTVVRVGGSKPIATDVRVLAATNQDLAQLVQEKKFRQDLYFRLNVVCLELAPLREREGDVLLLARHFLAEFCKRSRRSAPQITPAAEQALLQHTWPGNVRELRNMMERIAYLLEGDRIDAADLPFIRAAQMDAPDWLATRASLADATAEFQRQLIQRRIQEARGNMTEAAEQLDVHRSNLYRKMRQLGMEIDERDR